MASKAASAVVGTRVVFVLTNIAIVLNDSLHGRLEAEKLFNPYTMRRRSSLESAQTTPGRLRSCTLKTTQQSRRILPNRTPLGRVAIWPPAPARREHGRRRWHRAVWSTARPANAIALNRAASLIDTVNVRRLQRRKNGYRTRPPAADMYLNGLCPSALARRHYDARAMDTVQTDTLTDGWTDGFHACCTRTIKPLDRRKGMSSQTSTFYKQQTKCYFQITDY